MSEERQRDYMRLLHGEVAEHVREILREEVALSSMRDVERRTGIDGSALRKVADRQHVTMRFQVADRIVLCLRGPEQWHTDPVLASYYASSA